MGAAELRCWNAPSASHSLIACGFNCFIVPVSKLFKFNSIFQAPLTSETVRSLSDSNGEQSIVSLASCQWFLSAQGCAWHIPGRSIFTRNEPKPWSQSHRNSCWFDLMEQVSTTDAIHAHLKHVSASQITTTPTPKTSHYFQLNCSPKEIVISMGTWKGID